MPTAKVGEQSRLVKMKSTAKMQVYFEMAKEKRRFFVSPLRLQLFIVFLQKKNHYEKNATNAKILL